MSEWISVEDRLPEIGQEVICLGMERYIETDEDRDIPKERRVFDLGSIEKEGYILQMFAYSYGAYVTHWMPLPEPPK